VLCVQSVLSSARVNGIPWFTWSASDFHDPAPASVAIAQGSEVRLIDLPALVWTSLQSLGNPRYAVWQQELTFRIPGGVAK
jgi:hypothetical protein